MPTVNEVLLSACGMNEKDEPNSAIALTCYNVLPNENKQRKGLEIVSTRPKIEIYKRNEFIQIDIAFRSSLDNDLKSMWNALERYSKEVNEVTEESHKIPFITLTIMPHKYNGTHFITASKPVFWTLQPCRPGQPSSVIRTLYSASDVLVCETDEVDVNEIEKDLLREKTEQERQELLFEQMEQERKEHDAMRAELLEKYRRQQ